MADQQTAPEHIEIADNDRDSLNILPLAIIPLTTKGLRKSRMIKNARLETVIEIFSNDASGSLQLDIEGVPKHFGWVDGAPRSDLRVLRSLKTLSSFDIYSLRIQLRALGIEVANSDHLKLSNKKTQELADYMTEFTRPLIQNVFGSDENEVQDYADLTSLLRSASTSNALDKLNQMAEKMQIHLEDLPGFLEDCGDTFLSMAYYRQCFDQVLPIVKELLTAIGEMRTSFQLKTDRTLMQSCDFVEAKLKWMVSNLSKLFGVFDERLGDMWGNLSAERFREVKDAIERHHTTVGGLLCSLNVKMRAWSHAFPEVDGGGLIRRGEFLMTEIKQGLDTLNKPQDQGQEQEQVAPAA